MIWQATKDDIRWLMALAKECYPAFDVISSEKWLTYWIGNENILILRGDHSAAVAVVSSSFWQPDVKECELQFICSKKSRFGAIEVLGLLKRINELRKEKNCCRMYLNSRLADLEPFALKLGARLIGKSYVLED